ncbi:MAG: hypothetical protein MUE81_07560 [Thermoflexibacter sp.]|nr:hypothetical protein [Thermoflexibacter sp.]
MAWYKNNKEENLELKMFNYEITYEPISVNSTNAQELQMLQKLHQELKVMKKGLLDKLEILVKSYPHLPTLKNYLTMCYLHHKKNDKALQLAHATIEQHPDYLFGKLTLGKILLQDEKMDEVEQLLKDCHEITDLAPNRKEFHISEVEKFNALMIEYYLKKENMEAANSRLNFLKKLSPNSHQLEYLEDLANYTKLTINMKNMQEKMDNAPKIIVKAKKIFDQTTEPPVFKHQEIYHLYKYDWEEITDEYIRTILSLPRETLIEDLENVLEDALKRNDYFQKGAGELDESNSSFFPVHAIIFLAELGASKSIEKVLNLFRQDAVFYNFWMESYEEALTNALYKLIKNQLESVKNYFLEANHYTYLASILENALEYVFFLQPHRQQEVKEIYKTIFEHYLANEGNENIIDGILIGFFTSTATNFKDLELLGLLEQIYAKKLIDETICGDINDVIREFNSPPMRFLHIELDIFDTYADIRGERELTPEEILTAEERAQIMAKNPNTFSDIFNDDDDYEEEDDDDFSPFINKAVKNKDIITQDFSKFGRNDKVNVKYKDGTIQRDVKFKKVEDDLKNDKCVLI